jgi:CO/xanthine dehydrogenase Mo-binding subunit
MAEDAEKKPALPGDLEKFPLLDSWIRIDADGHITVFTGKAELGQGLKTALVQLAADELAVPPASIELVTADTARTPDEGVTAGSRSLSDSGTAVLNAAANVRQLLTETAAWRWLIAVEEVELHDGAAHAPNGDSLGYGELAAALSLHVDAKPHVARREKGVRLIGTDLPRVDIPAKVSGGAAYVQDMRRPGMLHARVVRGPSEGTRLKPADFDAVTKMPGVVRVVRDGGFTAVLAVQEWQAI